MATSERRGGLAVLLAGVPVLVFTAACGGGREMTGAGGGGGVGAGGGAGHGGGGGGPTCAPAAIYVAPDGAGDACSCAAPCALETGRDHARDVAPDASKDVVVQLRGGTYRLARTFELAAKDSGRSGHRIVYAAAPGDTPVLSGALRVTGFTPVAAGSAVWVASVPPGTASRQLYVDGRRATRARGPDAPAGYTKTATGFTLGDPAIASWPDRNGLELVSTKQWEMYRCPVTDVSAGGVTVAEPCWTNAQSILGFDSVGWLENALELLDEAGEWFLDSPGGKLYYAPRVGEDLGKVEVDLPVLEELVHGEGTPHEPLHDITFERVTFAHATWLGPSTPDGYASVQASVTLRGSPGVPVKAAANVTMHATHSVRFTSCTFEHLGGTGLAFEVGAQGNTVDTTRFEDISANAILVGDMNHADDHHPSDPALVVRDNTVRGSYVTRAGADYFDAPGILVGYTTHTTITNNELFDLPYSGISIGWGWGSVDVGGSAGYTVPSTSQANEVRNNLIGYHMRRLFDGGAIYVLGAQPGSVMDGNVISNQAAPYGNLYLDNGTQDYTLTNNVVLVYPKVEQASPDPDRSYWLYVQVGAPVATNNAESACWATDPTIFAPQPIDPSNTIAPASVLTAPSQAAAIFAAAGSPARSPEIAWGKPVTASSVYDAEHPAELANDNSAFDGWSPAADDPMPYWQVDLGGEFAVDGFEVVSRWSLDQPETRRSYRVVAADEPTFAKPVVLGEVDATGLPHQSIFAGDVSPPVKARYVRVEKTVAEYFFLGEVRVHGKPAP
jgi:F5/8 type C domain/Right handed beta helix region